MASNNDWVVPANVDQRRFVVIEAGTARMQDSTYFKALREQMGQGGRQALMQFLLDQDLSGVELRRIPRTDALAEQQLLSLDSVGQWLYAALDAGGFEEQGAGGIASCYGDIFKSQKSTRATFSTVNNTVIPGQFRAAPLANG